IVDCRSWPLLTADGGRSYLAHGGRSYVADRGRRCAVMRSQDAHRRLLSFVRQGVRALTGRIGHRLRVFASPPPRRFAASPAMELLCESRVTGASYALKLKAQQAGRVTAINR